MITVAIIGVLAGVAVPNYTLFAHRVRVKSTVAQLISHRNNIVSLRIVDDVILRDLTQSGCTRCAFAAVGSDANTWNPNATAERRYRRMGAEGVARDAWGRIMPMDENEREFSPTDCRYDYIMSVGANGIFNGGNIGSATVNDDDIMLIIPMYYPQNCVVQPGIYFGPNTWNNP
jgi:type II secretory pathway pseudopilin PulG